MKDLSLNSHIKAIVTCAFFIAMLFSSYRSDATHAMGADITYTCTGNPNEYNIRLTVFRDCNGIPLGATQTLNFSSTICGLNNNVVLTRIASSPTVVTPLCPTEPDVCVDGIGTYGIEEHIYEGTVTFPASCSDWLLNWNLCCRNDAITTLTDPGGDEIYIEAVLNNTLSVCNSSPTFLNDPTPFTCNNQQTFYNQGAVDPDNDSLVFSLTSCLQGSGVNVGYAGGFSGTVPLTTTAGVTVDPVTGAIEFTPNGVQVGILCILVEEFRNGVKIGEVVRDIQYTVLNCSNNLPISEPIPGTGGAYALDVCPGSNFCIDIVGTDPDNTPTQTQNLTMTWNGGIAGATFTVNGNTSSPTGTFCWTPTLANAGLNVFTVTTADDACPLSGLNTFTYTINVSDIANVASAGAAVLCEGGDISLTSTPSGGTPPYSYSWSGPNSFTSALQNPTITNVTTVNSGTYTVTMSDSGGCDAISSVTVTVNASPAATLGNGSNPYCVGETVSLTANPTAGTAPYTYSWSGPNSFTSASQNPSLGSATLAMGGTYSLTISDSNGCTGVESIAISVNANPTPTITASGPTTFCDYDDVTLNGPGGFAGYLWSNGATTQNITVNTSGTYSLVVTDANGCTGTSNSIAVVVNATTPISITPSGPTTFCDYDDITLDATPGFSSYIWSNGATTPSITVNTSGTYSITGTNSSGCTATATSTAITVNASPTAEAGTPGGSPYTGVQTHTIDAAPTATGGTGPYTYSWSTSPAVPFAGGSNATQPNPTFGPFPGPGSYTLTVIVTDVNGCTSTDNVVVNYGNCALAITSAVPTALTCNSDGSGSIDVTVTGATGTVVYTWSGPTTIGNVQDPANLSAGNYGLTITDDAGCIATTTVTVTEPAVPSLDITPGGPTTFCDYDDVVLNATPGFASYAWSNSATGASITVNTSGTYSVTATTAAGCTAVSSTPISVTVNPSPTAEAGTPGGSPYTGVQTHTIDAAPTASGGTVPYTYSWTTSPAVPFSGGSSATDANPTFGPFPTSGSYTLTVIVTDANGCTSTDNVVVNFGSCALTIDSATPTNLLCNGDGGGSIDVTISGATGTVVYTWTGPTSIGNIQDPTSLSAGTYNLTITDDAGCIATTSVTITEPPVLTGSATQTGDIQCNGDANGAATAAGAGGNPPYSYIWSDGQVTAVATGLAENPYSVTITDANGCFVVENIVLFDPDPLIPNATGNNPTTFGGSDGSVTSNPTGGTPSFTYVWSTGQTTQTVTGLAAGTYIVTVTDANGCTAVQSVILSNPSCDLTITGTTNTDVSCNGFSDGTATVTATSSNPPFTYIWSNGQSTQTATALVSGVYDVTVTDAINCEQTASVAVNEPTALGLSISPTDPTTLGGTDGTATANPTGGTPPYTYNWSNGQTGQTATGLSMGTYSVTVTDANGCTISTSTILNDPGCNGIAVGVSSTDVSCNGFNDGTATANTTGGNPPFTYLWSDGQTTQIATGLGGGSFGVTVTDAVGCEAFGNASIDEPSVLSAGLAPQNITCNGFDDGIIDLTVNGGVLPYTYLWSDGFILEDRTGLSPGAYSVTVTDANGCEVVQSTVLSEPPVLTTTVTLSNFGGFNVSAAGATDGTATANPNGGFPPYFYSWSDGQTTQTASGLGAGTYTITITDSNGCTVSETVVLTEPGTFVITGFTSSDATCNGFADGSATVNVSGGVAPYTYNWSNGETTQSITGLAAGTYTVTVTDVNGVVATGVNSVTIGEPTVVSGTIAITSDYNGQDISCNGNLDGEATVTPTGGTPGYTYQWDNGQTTATATGLNAGPHTVTITDSNGCTGVVATTLSEPAVLTAGTCTSANDECQVDAGVVIVEANGGTGPYQVTWTPLGGTTTQPATITTPGTGNGVTITGLTGGTTYSFTVTDANGCVVN